MTAFTSKATGLWDAEGQTTWNEAGHPQAADTVENQAGDTVTCDSPAACTTLLITDGILDLDTFDLTVSSDFTRNGGAIDTGTGELFVGGDVSQVGGTGRPSITQTGTSTLSWTASAANAMEMLTTAVGAIITTAGNVITRSLTIEGSLSGAHTVTINPTSSNWWGTQLGSFDCDLTISNAKDRDPGSEITVATGNTVLITDSQDATLTPTPYTRLDLADCRTLIKGTGAGDVCPIVVSGFFSAGELVLGDDNTSGSGLITVEGSADIDTLAAGDSTNTNNALILPGSLRVRTTLNAQYMDFTADHGHLHGATLTNATVTGELNAWGVIEGAGNSGDIRHHGGAEVGAAVGTLCGLSCAA